MEKAQKWNFKTEEYEPYEVPDEAALWGESSMDADEVITCAECGKKILYRDGYVSRKIHAVSGMWYAVCEQCWDKELDEELMEVKRALIYKEKD